MQTMSVSSHDDAPTVLSVHFSCVRWSDRARTRGVLDLLRMEAAL